VIPAAWIRPVSGTNAHQSGAARFLMQIGTMGHAVLEIVSFPVLSYGWGFGRERHSSDLELVAGPLPFERVAVLHFCASTGNRWRRPQ